MNKNEDGEMQIQVRQSELENPRPIIEMNKQKSNDDGVNLMPSVVSESQ